MIKARSIMDRIIQNRYVIPVIAFLIPMIVRTIPEILVGPHIIGFDTMGFYVPNSISWLHDGLGLLDFLETAPLFYVILICIVKVGLPLLLSLKFLSPLLLGFLGLSIYVYARQGLKWSNVKSLVPALLGTIYFVALRISWDLLRNELGLIFFFIVLTLLFINKGLPKSYLLISLMMLAVVTSHQLVSIIMFGVLIFMIVHKLLLRKMGQTVKLFLSVFPSVLFFVYFYFLASPQISLIGYSPDAKLALDSWFGFTSYSSMLVSEGGFFLYCFLPLLPLAIVSFSRFRNFQLLSWSAFILILLLSPIALASPYRWVLLLMYPLIFYTTESLSCLRSYKWKRYTFPGQRIAIAYLVLSTAFFSCGYVFMTPDQPFPYFNQNSFNQYIYQIPSSMLQNTIPITDFQDTANSLQWFKNNQSNSSLLLTHTVFYGWGLLSLEANQIKNYGFQDPEKAANATAHEGYNEIYLIWWLPGEGWYGKQTLPASFLEIYHSGRIAIYSYNTAC